jgi:hypothetical protein
MKERPILFTGPMVRAILEGRKTQTRRVVKPQPREAPILGYPGLVWKNKHWAINDTPRFVNPYGQPGDRLWVRETWSRDDQGKVWYRADGEDGGAAYGGVDLPGGATFYPGAWKPSIHMPRWASRILLEIVSVRVERVQEISEDGTKPEGFDLLSDFINTWNRLNAARGFGWDKNPWVWCIEFKRVESRPVEEGRGK